MMGLPNAGAGSDLLQKQMAMFAQPGLMANMGFPGLGMPFNLNNLMPSVLSSAAQFH